MVGAKTFEGLSRPPPTNRKYLGQDPECVAVDDVRLMEFGTINV